MRKTFPSPQTPGPRRPDRDLEIEVGGIPLVTRSRALVKPTQLSGRLFEAAQALLQPLADGTPYRLIGIGVSHLTDAGKADQSDLADARLLRDKATETAIDALRAKIWRGSDCARPPVRAQSPQSDALIAGGNARISRLVISPARMKSPVDLQCPGDTVFVKIERHHIARRAILLVGIKIADRDRPAVHPLQGGNLRRLLGSRRREGMANDGERIVDLLAGFPNRRRPSPPKAALLLQSA